MRQKRWESKILGRLYRDRRERASSRIAQGLDYSLDLSQEVAMNNLLEVILHRVGRHYFQAPLGQGDPVEGHREERQ